MGVTGTGAVAGYYRKEDIYIDQGPSNNVIGTPALADRNVLGNAFKAIDMYGPGTNGNVIQNNDILHDAHPGARVDVRHRRRPRLRSQGHPDRRLRRQREERHRAHDRSTASRSRTAGIPTGQDTSTKWREHEYPRRGQLDRLSRSTAATTRLPLRQTSSPAGNDGNGVNVYDGCSNNVVDGNFIGSVYDGVNTHGPQLLRQRHPEQHHRRLAQGSGRAA